MDNDPITGSQCRAARALLDWSANDLAARSSVAVGTIRRLERGGHANRSTMALLRSAIERAGIDFIPESRNGGPGVRLKRTRVAEPKVPSG
jgi:transcriptional regulator with XRE-family HTH domain